jgi:hypothetical protein
MVDFFLEEVVSHHRRVGCQKNAGAVRMLGVNQRMRTHVKKRNAFQTLPEKISLARIGAEVNLGSPGNDAGDTADFSGGRRQRLPLLVFGKSIRG